MRIPVISLWQPWGTAIAMGKKTIETRQHNRFAHLAGKLIAIHAGQRMDENFMRMAAKYIPQSICMSVFHQARKERGKILCVARVTCCRELVRADSKAALCTAEGLYGLCLRDIRRLPAPIVVRGSQGVWYYDIPDRSLKNKEKENSGQLNLGLDFDGGLD